MQAILILLIIKELHTATILYEEQEEQMYENESDTRNLHWLYSEKNDK